MFLAIKKKALTHTAKWMNLDNIMLRSQSQRPHTVGLRLYGMSRMGRSTETEHRCLVARSCVEEGDVGVAA